MAAHAAWRPTRCRRVGLTLHKIRVYNPPMKQLICLGLTLCLTGLAACGMVQQTNHDAISAEPGRAPLTTGLRATNPEMFTCSEDAECATAPKSGCNNGIIEAVRRDAVQTYTRLARQQRQNPCAYIWVEDRRVAHCHAERRQCELTSASSETP